MLTITPQAAEAVRALAADSGLMPDPGLRLAAAATPSGSELHVSLVAGPEASDETIDADGAVVYVESRVAELLGDKVLDAAPDGDRIRLILRRGPSAG